MPAQTIAEIFQAAVRDHGPRTAMRYRRQGDWHPVTYAQLGRLVEEATVGLAQLGLAPGDVVGLVADEGPLATVADLATVHAGAVLAPLDPSTDADTLVEALLDAGAELVFAEPGVAGALVEAIAEREAGLVVVVLEDAEPSAVEAGEAIGMRELYRRGQQVLGEKPEPFEQRWRAIEADQPATLLRLPEGERIELAHGEVAAHVAAAAAAWPLDPGERAVCLASSAERFGREVGRLALYAQGAEVWFPEEQALAAHLRGCQPHLLLASEGSLARLRADVDERLDASQPLQRQLYAWAHDTGKALAEARAEDGGAGLGLRLRRWLAEGLVLAQVRAEIGLERARILATPDRLPADLARWLRAIGAPLVEAYTDPVAGLVTAPRPGEVHPDARGEPAPRVDVRRAEEDGEWLVRGPSVPEAGRAEDGWRHTGDAGSWIGEGQLAVEEERA